MSIEVSIEQLEERWVAHVTDLPGCFVTRETWDEALIATPQAVANYAAWCAAHAIEVAVPSGKPVLVELVRAWPSGPRYEVNAFFAADRPPLQSEELPQFNRLLAAARRDLWASLEDLSDDDLARELPGERWPIAGVLKHLAIAEWWYLDRLDLAFPRATLPSLPQDRLAEVRSHFEAALPALQAFDGMVNASGETWSARKVLRRALWHERDHTEHIGKMKLQLAAEAGSA